MFRPVFDFSSAVTDAFVAAVVGAGDAVDGAVAWLISVLSGAGAVVVGTVDDGDLGAGELQAAMASPTVATVRTRTRNRGGTRPA
jgi:hypothetical protein